MTFLNSLVVLAAGKTADIPQGTELTIPESFAVALFCMAIVFAVLASLFILIKIFSVGVRIVEAHAVQQVTPNAQVAPAAVTGASPHVDSGRAAYAGQLKLRSVDEPTAALIMAIVSDESGIPLSELCFKSIRKMS